MNQHQSGRRDDEMEDAEPTEVSLGMEDVSEMDEIELGGMPEDMPEEIEALGKIRYNHRGDTCKVKRIGEDLLECHFDTPVRAVTPGQALVLYQGEHVLGGGTIV